MTTLEPDLSFACQDNWQSRQQPTLMECSHSFGWIHSMREYLCSGYNDANRAKDHRKGTVCSRPPSLQVANWYSEPHPVIVAHILKTHPVLPSHYPTRIIDCCASWAKYQTPRKVTFELGCQAFLISSCLSRGNQNRLVSMISFFFPGWAGIS